MKLDGKSIICGVIIGILLCLCIQALYFKIYTSTYEKQSDSSKKTIAITEPEIKLITKHLGEFNQKNDEKIFIRWLPRLNDISSEVRGEAARELSSLALRNPAYRTELIPILLEQCKTDAAVAVYIPILDRLSSYALASDEWREQFIDIYIFLARINPSKTSQARVGYKYLWEIIDKGFIDKSYKRMPEILELANVGLEDKYDIRSYSMNILDWYNDQ